MLCDQLSIVDVVKIYLQSSSGDGDVYSYEKFYAWLRTLANLLYRDEPNSRRCFHRLLTEVDRYSFVKSINIAV